MTRSSRLGAGALCAFLACATRLEEPQPRPKEVIPPVGHQEVETPIVIRGDDFQPVPYQDANGRPEVDATFRAWLGGVELGGVAWTSEHELRARVPPGLPLGVQRLELRSPAGEVGTLDGAFTVLPGTGAVLGATATLVPGVAIPGQAVTLTVSVTNGGDAAATGVAVAASVTGSALVLSPPAPGPQDVAPGATAVFVQSGVAAVVGSAFATLSAAGTDASSGQPVSASTVTGTLVVQPGEATKVLDDPFGDGTPFSFVFGYDGHVFLGPSGDGRGVVRCLSDGTGCGSFGFSFTRDVNGSTVSPDLYTTLSQNTVCGALTTLGSAPACDPVSPQTTACSCGPDYESGRGLMGSVTLGSPAEEWLVAMGRTEKAGTLSYLYMTRDVGSPLGFSYVDLYTAMPLAAGVTDVASTAVLNDRLYLGLQVVDTDRPRIAVLTRTPAPPGLDCTASDAFATTLQQTSMGENGSGLSQVDAMIGFEGRLFVANRRAVLVSKTGFPTGDPDARNEFDDCTPTVDWEATSIVKYAGKIDITPADRGVAGLAAWGGRLYLGRNTRPAAPGALPEPELWVFTPRHDTSGAFMGCLSTDWQRIPASFDAGNTLLSALFASGSFLYVGYDNPAGVQLYRTSSSVPAGESDFTGHLSCTAPCTPLGGAGFGDPANVRLLDARSNPFRGVDQVWAVVGSGAGPVRVFRISE